jgi:hypothetical protein
MRYLAFAAALLLTACTSEEGPLMAPGEDCQDCHSGGEAKAWSFAGTVFTAEDADLSQGVQGVTVTVTDANGKKVTVRSNQAGNFYSAERLVPPLRTSISRGGRVSEMEDTFEYGGCNNCHTWPRLPAYDTGRLKAP